jgi:hypothetical protein
VPLYAILPFTGMLPAIVVLPFGGPALVGVIGANTSIGNGPNFMV